MVWSQKVKRTSIPKEGIDHSFLLKAMNKIKEEEQDVDWRHGRGWSLVYFEGEKHTEFLKQVYALFFSENGLSPSAFPSLRKFESEVVAMILDLLGSQDSEVGNMTSGGTESILLAMKTYRDQARTHKKNITHPEILVPESAHPAFLKAAQYFDLRVVPLSLDSDFRADINSIENKLTDQTVCIVASAPCYPYGVIDPIPEMGRIALENGIGLHVDACLGGFLLPFMRKQGYPVRDFDFSVPGVTSISSDLHKNGYAAKGASAILYKNSEIRRFQYFVNSEWPGGLYASPTMLGTRPGGTIACAWAALLSLGQKGYMEIAKRTMEVTEKLVQGVEQIPELFVGVPPDMSVITIRSTSVNIFGVADRMEKKGWRIDRQHRPECIHLIATPNHAQAVEPFLKDLREVTMSEAKHPSERSINTESVLYGVTTTISYEEDLDMILRSNLDETYRVS